LEGWGTEYISTTFPRCRPHKTNTSQISSSIQLQTAFVLLSSSSSLNNSFTDPKKYLKFDFKTTPYSPSITMTRADTEQVKVHYKGKEDDFIVLAESIEAVKKWKADKTIPLIDVVNSFDVFTTNK
jgi:Shwachman-Bodian-Diamond syndrome (SBDS) protein